jgi:integrase
MAKRRRNREGTIYQRNDKWVGQVTVDGDRLTKSFNTMKECQAWIREVNHQIDVGLTNLGIKMSLEEYLDIWLENIKGSIRSTTWLRYEGVVRLYLKPYLGKIKLNDLKPFQIQRFYTQLREQGRSPRQIELTHATLRRAYFIAVRQGYVAMNPVKQVDPPRVPQKELTILDDNQVREFMIAAQGNRHETLYFLAITTGIRQGELLGLKWQDVDWATKEIFVQRQLQWVSGEGYTFSPPKTKTGRRKIALGEEAMKRLTGHRKKQDLERLSNQWQEHDLVFPSTIGTPMGLRNLLRSFKQLLKLARLPDMRFHDLRHTAATLMLMNGIPIIVVSRRLGHSKPSVTLDIYSHYLPGMQVQAAALMDELVTPIPIKLQQIAAGPSEQ